MTEIQKQIIAALIYFGPSRPIDLQAKIGMRGLHFPVREIQSAINELLNQKKIKKSDIAPDAVKI
jgi:hypothetical protein